MRQERTALHIYSTVKKRLVMNYQRLSTNSRLTRIELTSATSKAVGTTLKTRAARMKLIPLHIIRLSWVCNESRAIAIHTWTLCRWLWTEHLFDEINGKTDPFRADVERHFWPLDGWNRAILLRTQRFEVHSTTMILLSRHHLSWRYTGLVDYRLKLKIRKN